MAGGEIRHVFPEQMFLVFQNQPLLHQLRLLYLRKYVLPDFRFYLIRARDKCNPFANRPIRLINANWGC